MKIKYFYLFKATSKIDGKWYIGRRTTYKIPQYDSYLGSGHRIKNAVNLYGEDSFVKEILAYHKSVEELKDAETLLLTLLDAANDTMSLNLTNKGGGGSDYCSEEAKRKMSKTLSGRKVTFSESHRESIRKSLTGKRHTQERRNNISKAKKGQKVSQETKDKLSLLNRGKGNGFYGKKHTEETLAKLRMLRHTDETKEIIRQKALERGYKGNKNPAYDHTIYIFRNIHTGEIYEGTRHNFKITYNLDNHINCIIYGKRKICKGWEYLGIKEQVA